MTDLRSTNGTYVDGKRIDDSTLLPDGSILEIGQQVLKHERRSTREVKEAQELDRDLEKARNYVLSLLPSPIVNGTRPLLPASSTASDEYRAVASLLTSTTMRARSSDASKVT